MINKIAMVIWFLAFILTIYNIFLTIMLGEKRMFYGIIGTSGTFFILGFWLGDKLK